MATWVAEPELASESGPPLVRIQGPLLNTAVVDAVESAAWRLTGDGSSLWVDMAQVRAVSEGAIARLHYLRQLARLQGLVILLRSCAPEIAEALRLASLEDLMASSSPEDSSRRSPPPNGPP
ncbi:MAG: STAS domain-containing protein [Spirochaetes bacterium]|nr:STAS domain-containing protein [Spirochaetota bacterium]